MNLRSIIFVIFAALNMSACSHWKSTETSKTKQTNASVSSQQSGKLIASPAPVLKPTPIPAATSPTAATVSLSKPPSYVAQQVTPQPERYTNILNRIRANFSLPEFNSPHVDNYIRLDTASANYLQNLFTRAAPFLFYIVEELEKRNMPMELALLPAIESAYKPKAISSSKAAGLWQFIPSTGRYVGLPNNAWFDGRKDFIKSTNAALDYLSMLNNKVGGDWFLTLAAYNAGIGTVTRAINNNKSKGKGTHYLDLNLRSETERYVPKLIALKKILQAPSRFNVHLPAIQNQAHFVEIEISQPINLRLFAKQLNMKFEDFSHLNAGFLKNSTPHTGSYSILVPIQKTTLAKSLIVSNSALYKKSSPTKDNSNKQKLITHRVNKGDTLWSISRRYDVRIQQLRQWNSLSKRHILSLNQALKIYPN